MVIAVVLETFPKASERFIARELSALTGLGLDLRVFALTRGPDALLAEEPFSGLAGRVRWLPGVLSAKAMAEKARIAVSRPARLLRLLPGAVSSEIRDPARLAALLPRLAWAPALARAAEKAGAGLIWAHFASLPGALGWMASRLAGVPFALSVHAWDIFVNKALVAAQLEEAQLVTACSAAARDFLRERYGASADKVELVYHGVPESGDAGTRRRGDAERETTNRGSADAGPEALKSPGDSSPCPRVPVSPCPRVSASPRHVVSASPRPFRVLAVGRLVPKKGFRHLVEAAALSPGGFEVEFAGDGPERADLERLAAARRVSGRIRFSGELDGAGLAAAFARSDAVCAPSVVAPDGDRDGVPNSLLEAMAAGLPAVAADAGGLAEAVEDGRTGLLVPPADPGALAEAIERLEGDADLPRRLAAGAAELLRERFSLEKNAARLAGLLAATSPDGSHRCTQMNTDGATAG